MRGIAAAAAACVCAMLGTGTEARVFSYHHAEGQRSQQGHHSAHSASQIALPEMRFASQHASITASTSAGTGASAAAGQHLAAAASALAHASAAATDASAAAAASEVTAERLRSKLSRATAQRRAHAKAATTAHAAASATVHAAKAGTAAKAGAAATAGAGAEAVPGGGAAEGSPSSAGQVVNGYPGDMAVSTAKLSSPLYGSYAHNYGSVSQPLAEGSGYGGFTGNVDPTGFNFQHDDTTATGGQKGWGASTLSGLPFGAAYPARMKVRQATSVNGLSPLGITASLSDASYTLMGPKSLGPYGVDGKGTMSTGPGAALVGYGLALPAIVSSPGYAPLASVVTTVGSSGGGAAGSGRRTRGRQHVVVINAAPRADAGAQLAGLGAGLASAGPPVSSQVMGVGQNVPNTAASSSPSSVALLSGRPLVNGAPVNGLRLTYDPAMVTQRALYMGGGVNTFQTPGVVKQLGVSYPSPAFDRYASVVPTSKLSMPVHTSPLSSMLLAANINANLQRNMNEQRDPVTGLPLAMSAMMMGGGMPMGGGMGGMGGAGAMGGGAGGAGAMGGGMGGGGMGGMGGGMGGMGGV